MKVGSQNRDLKTLLAEASQALLRFDGPSLDEIASSTAASVRELDCGSGPLRLNLTEIRVALAVFRRVVEATRANLDVLHKLRDREAPDLSYSLTPRQSTLDSAYGNN